MKRAYIDTNVFVEIEQGKATIQEIIEKIDPEISTIYYSSAHIQESEEIKGETPDIRNQRIEKRLNTIQAVTQNNYLYSNMENEVYLQIESPSSVLETIRDVPGTNEIMKSFTSMVTEDQKEQFRSALELDPKKINNYSPQEVIDQFNTKLTKWGTDLSFLELIEQSIGFHPQGQTFGLSHRMAAMFELLDMLGYWKDKSTESSNYARFWDSNHAYFASYCHYFISDDKRTRYKSKVIYQLMNIGTQIFSTDGKCW